MERMDDKLDALWAQYRQACPDPDPSPHFMPRLWQRIEARRGAAASMLFRRWTEIWVVASLALALVMGAYLIPQFQNPPAYQASYVDVLSAADSASDAVLLPVGESE